MKISTKLSILFVTIFFLSTNLIAQVPQFELTKVIGGVSSSGTFSPTYPDDNGNFYNIGGFDTTTDFDPGPGTMNHNSK